MRSKIGRRLARVPHEDGFGGDDRLPVLMENLSGDPGIVWARRRLHQMSDAEAVG